jgi:hypothetical protein
MRAASCRIQHLPRPRDPVERRRDELLPAESRIHRHDEQQIDLVQHVLHRGERRRRIQRDASLASELANAGKLSV